jgi:hypothetical protein
MSRLYAKIAEAGENRVIGDHEGAELLDPDHDFVARFQPWLVLPAAD